MNTSKGCTTSTIATLTLIVMMLAALFLVGCTGDTSDEGSSSSMGPDTTPTLEDGVVRVTLGWDEAIDMDLEIWDEDGIEAITSAGATNEDVKDGTQGREYFDFIEYDEGDMSTGDYMISVYFAEEFNTVDSAYATLIITDADGNTTQRNKTVMWAEGQDQWHAFRIDAETGDIEDVDEFIETETETE